MTPTSLKPSTTCQLVRMRPSAEITEPEPTPSSVSTITTEGDTWRKILDSLLPRVVRVGACASLVAAEAAAPASRPSHQGATMPAAGTAAEADAGAVGSGFPR